MRGEQNKNKEKEEAQQGSPPLARGTAKLSFELLHCTRITPACAGNSVDGLFWFNEYRDHPRLRGEQLLAALLYQLIKGSPPLARGTAHALPVSSVLRGITPACAGNSSTNFIIFIFF